MVDKKKIFQYVRENIPIELLIENDVDYILDFKNGNSMQIDTLNLLYDTYNEMEDAINVYCNVKGLDNVIDYREIISTTPFSNWNDKGYILSYQVTLIDFHDFVLKYAISLAT